MKALLFVFSAARAASPARAVTRAVVAGAVLVALIGGCSTFGTSSVEMPKLDPGVMAAAHAYLAEYGASPVEYVVAAFEDHDVVFLGEYHRIKSQVELVSTLLPAVHDAGINILATEFARRVDQPLLDQLVSGRAWNEELAREITFRNFVCWGYREYVDILHAAWAINQDLDEGEVPFRVLALNNAPDWSVLKTPADRNNPELRRRVWKGQTERDWAAVVLDEVLGTGRKALVYCGIHHGFTSYRQPIYDIDAGKLRGFARDRMGNHVYEAIGERAMTVYMHAPWVSAEGYDAPDVHPVDGAIDVIMQAAQQGAYPVAFDTEGTPFGNLRASTSFYRYGYPNFTLADFCDGYIYLEPFRRMEGVTPIPHFINDSNLAIAQAQCPNPAFRQASAERLNSAIEADARIARRFRHLVIR
jgi:hypothetical protein